MSALTCVRCDRNDADHYVRLVGVKEDRGDEAAIGARCDTCSNEILVIVGLNNSAIECQDADDDDYDD